MTHHLVELRDELAGKLEALQNEEIHVRHREQSECDTAYQRALVAWDDPHASEVRAAKERLDEAATATERTEARIKAMAAELVSLDARIKAADLDRAFRQDFAPHALAAVKLAMRLEAVVRDVGETYDAFTDELTLAYSKFPAHRDQGRNFGSPLSLERQKLWVNTLEALWWASRGKTLQAHPVWSREVAASGAGPKEMKIAAETVSELPHLVEKHGGPPDLVAALRAALTGEPVEAPTPAKGKKGAA